MSYIMQTLECKKCQRQINVALGTFGSGMPERCECGESGWKIIADGEWKAKTPPPETIESAVSRFDEKFKCINSQCDSKGSIPHQVSEDEWEAEQCQYCFEYLFPMRAFLETELTRAREEGAEKVRSAIQKELELRAETMGEDGRLAAIHEGLDIAETIAWGVLEGEKGISR